MFSKQFVFPPIKEELYITCRQFYVDNRFSVVQWLDHVARMDETTIRKRVLKGKLYVKRRMGRPKIRWLEDVIVDLRRMGISGWMEKTRNKDQWRRILRRPRPTQGCSAEKKKNRFSVGWIWSSVGNWFVRNSLDYTRRGVLKTVVDSNYRFPHPDLKISVQDWETLWIKIRSCFEHWMIYRRLLWLALLFVSVEQVVPKCASVSLYSYPLSVSFIVLRIFTTPPY